MLVVEGNTVGVLLVIWMEVVCREHVGHSQEGMATQRNMPERFLCGTWEHC